MDQIKNTNIVSSSEIQQLEDLLLKHIGAFGLKRSLVRMSLLPPMKVRLKPDVRPFKAPFRYMGVVQLEAMRQKIEDLVKIGMLKQCDDPYFSSPAFMVSKKKRLLENGH